MRRIIPFLMFIILLAFPEANLFSQRSRDYKPVLYAVPSLDYETSAGIIAFAGIGAVAPPNSNVVSLNQNPALLYRNQKLKGGFLDIQSRNTSTDDLNLVFNAAYNNYFKSKYAYSINFIYSSNENPVFSGKYYGLKKVKPWQEYVLSVSIAQSLSKTVSLGRAIKFFHSNKYHSDKVDGMQTKGVTSFALDLGIDYRDSYTYYNNNKFFWEVGLSINNIGPRVNYFKSNKDHKEFIPSSYAIGTLWNFQSRYKDKRHFELSFAYMIKRYLVPTPPVRKYNENTGSYERIKGYNDNVSAMSGIVQSFYDAPYGFEEEWRENIHHFGLEYSMQLSGEMFFETRMGRVIWSDTKSPGNSFQGGVSLRQSFYFLELAFNIYDKNNDYNYYSLSLGFKINDSKYYAND